MMEIINWIRSYYCQSKRYGKDSLRFKCLWFQEKRTWLISPKLGYKGRSLCTFWYWLVSLFSRRYGKKGKHSSRLTCNVKKVNAHLFLDISNHVLLIGGMFIFTGTLHFIVPNYVTFKNLMPGYIPHINLWLFWQWPYLKFLEDLEYAPFSKNILCLV